jgi:hypothetical protein
MNWLEFTCPGCHKKKVAAPGDTYLICSRCASPHCHSEDGMCHAPGCNGRLHEAINAGGGRSRFPLQAPPVHYDP